MKLLGIKQIAVADKYLGLNISFHGKEAQILMDRKNKFLREHHLGRVSS